MPNTYEFFHNGYINHNCRANGEWTLPSLMSMCTGKYTTNHYVFHTDAPHQGEQINKMIQEYFEEAGYMTGRICPNWRGTPSYGYFKGINRFVYAPMLNRMFCEEVATETLEHIETFKDFNNYVWMTMEDLHAVADGVSRGILYDSHIEHYLTEDVSEDSEISVFRNFNRTKINLISNIIHHFYF
jgi:arylsulfatase A-like enzyme